MSQSQSPNPDHGTEQEELRKEARARIKTKRGFKQLAGVFAIVWAILVTIWYMSGGGYFWPAWPILGMSIALAFIALGAYGPSRRITQEQIDAEVRKMRDG